MQGHLFFIMWVSGSGKGTLRENLMKLHPEYIFLKSYVTRDTRPWEKSWEQYYFVDEVSFLKDVEKWEFLEYEWVHKAWYYGTKIQEVNEWIDAGQTLFKEVDTKWLKQIHEKHPDFRSKYTSIFLDVPDDILRKRFFERNPTWCEADFQNRLESSIFERKQAEEYCDYIIDATQSPESVLEDVLAIIEYTWNSTS